MYATRIGPLKGGSNILYLLCTFVSLDVCAFLGGRGRVVLILCSICSGIIAH